MENSNLELMTKGFIQDRTSNFFLNMKDSDRAYVYTNFF